MPNATNEIVTAHAPADNNSNSSSDDISDMTSHSHTLLVPTNGLICVMAIRRLL